MSQIGMNHHFEMTSDLTAENEEGLKLPQGLWFHEFMCKLPIKLDYMTTRVVSPYILWF